MSRRARSLSSLVALALMCAALASALWITRSLASDDHVDKRHVAAFDSRPMRTLSLGSVTLPSPGTVRLVLCPSARAPALVEGGSSLVLRVRDREVARASFARDDGRGRRCLEATAHGSGEVSITAELSESIATSVASVERFSHRRFTILFALPSLGFVLGLAWLLFSRQSVVEARDQDATATPDEHYAPPTAPASWPWGWTFAIGAYLAVQLVNVVVAVAWIAFYRPEGAADGLTIAVSTLSQHALLSVASFALLGALRTDAHGVLAPDWRTRLGFTPISLKGALASVTLALSLVAVAIASTKLIPDLNSSPLGQLLERSPPRYAIAFGAMIAPFSEELFFRGVLVTAFGRKSVWRGALVSTIVFTLAHAAQLRGAWAGLIPICAVGACNAALRARTGSLSYPWLVHTLYNGALTASLYFT